MSLTGIDVSSYQGTINWWAVKQNGIDFAILKVIRKDLNPDKKFEENWKGCKEHNVHVHGVYEYGYITTVAKSRSDARRVLTILNGRKVTVYLDVEDAVMKGLGNYFHYQCLRQGNHRCRITVRCIHWGKFLQDIH